jgi:ketosteroid isomerase-like protein
MQEKSALSARISISHFGTSGGHVTLATPAAAKRLVAWRQLCHKEAMYAKRLLILGLFCCLPALSMAQQQASPETTVLALEKKWTDAYKLRNITLLTSMLADDFLITVEDGNIYGKMGYMSHTADTSTQVDVAEESDLKVRMHGNVAVVTGAYHETGTSKGKRYEYRDRLTDIWMKIDGQWRLIAAQYSVPLAQ